MSENKTLDTVIDLNELINGDKNIAEMMLRVVTAESLGMAMHNAVSAQHNAQILNAAIVAATCNKILAVRGVNTNP